jgi:leucyl aminopeptidase
MKISFSSKKLETLPKSVVRVVLVEEKGARRLVREKGGTTIELSLPTTKTQRTGIILMRSIIASAKHFKARAIALEVSHTTWKPFSSVDSEHLFQLMGENFEMSNFEYTPFKTKPKDGWNMVEEVILCGNIPAKEQTACKRGQTIGEEVNKTRSLSNTPGGDMTPKGLADAAKKAAKGLPVTVTTLSKTQMEKLGMGALLGVGKGSTHPPTFTIMEYRGGAKSEAPIVLAGKGITFDSGGLNLKPSTGIYEMHMDMSGAASVIHTVTLCSRLKVKKNVVGLIPSAENMPGNEAYRPGDILRSMSGKTIEVLNTDAEGRLVLADALTYAKKYKPAVVVDVATLTGAALSALGLYASAVMSKDEKLSKKLQDLGEQSGEYVWPLPLWDEYEQALQGTFADLSNIGTGAGGRYGGAIEGGMFLWQFAKELNAPWAHIDIAPRMTSAPGDELAKGAAGAPVRLLFSFIEQWTNPRQK